LLPPNMNFFVRPDYISVYTSWPLTVDSMRMSGVILWSRDTVEGPNRDRVVGEFKHMLDKVMAEDFSMVESLQNTAVSSGFCPGRMSRLERGVQHFIKHSLNRVLGERTAVHGAVEGRERGARAMSAAVLQYPLDAGGATVRVVQHGSAGPLVLFLHGLGSHADAWSQVAPALGAEGRRCLAVDLPGHGLSSKGPGFDYTLDGHVRWLAALIEALGEPQVHVVASSLGGLWAAGFAMRFPQRISSLTLIGALGLATLTAERRRWTAQYLREMDRESIADRLRRAVAEPAVIDENFIEQTFRMNNSPGAGEAFAALGRYYLERINDDMQLEPLIAVARSWPLLLIWGREDATVPYADAAAAAKRIPGCALFALDRTRHVPQLERPELVRGILSRQLRGEPLPAGPIEGGEIVSSTLDHTAAR
ncbi:MAG TPA: alpha/beta fold hydrolase, partial [Steroidobacteraceae bacterium]|nr:alpha/beta fold hydrolase [Steroidobacteraceae bacterium]